MSERRKTIDSVRLSSTHTACDLLDALLAMFPERSQVITRERFGILDGNEKTLEEIGKKHGITRERVRQIVDVIMKRVTENLKHERGHALVARVIETVKQHGGIMSIDAILSELGGENHSERKALLALLPSLPGCRMHKESEKHKSVVVTDDFSLDQWEKLIGDVVSVLEETADVQSIEELYTLFLKKSGATEITQDMFESLLAPAVEVEKNAFGHYGLVHWSTIRPRGTRERAHLILRVMKKPLHFREIARLIDTHGLYKAGKQTHPQTVHNELIKDTRFVLVGRGTYALSDWGFRPGTVREVLASILKDNEQPMSREELLRAVMKVRQVKRSTVIINLNSFFTKVGKNIYSLSDGKE
jgi:hypothetical protein